MPSIAIIGADGAGKTTVTRMLLEENFLPFRYLYMGVNVGSSNVALPTSRLAQWIKGLLGEKGDNPRNSTSLSTSGASRRLGSKSKFRNALRLANRVAEELYRLVLSRWYELRGLVPLYDRHFTFDFFGLEELSGYDRLSDRIHAWFLKRIYPRPNLVIFLDAPPEVLMARKGEGTFEYLESRRRAYLRLGETMPDFIRVDATQPLARVYEEVSDHIRRYSNGRTKKSRR
ncbi:MAG: hypothetical protein OEU36_21160 [Gammaproteobacteria bacterium]|nr:hypothetical protein [Gammaproteobacteria bacterium]